MCVSRAGWKMLLTKCINVDQATEYFKRQEYLNRQHTKLAIEQQQWGENTRYDQRRKTANCFETLLATDWMSRW